MQGVSYYKRTQGGQIITPSRKKLSNRHKYLLSIGKLSMAGKEILGAKRPIERYAEGKG